MATASAKLPLAASVGNISMGYATSWTSVALPHLIDCADNPAKPEGCDFGSDAEMTTDQVTVDSPPPPPSSLCQSPRPCSRVVG